MRRRSRSGLVFLLLCFNFILTYAQNISGKIVDTNTGVAQAGLLLTLENTDKLVYTNGSGKFIFENIPAGNYNLLAKVSDQLFIISTFEHSSANKDLGEIKFTAPVVSSESDFSVIDISDLAGIENENDNFSSALSAGRDVFVNAAAYNFSTGRFRPRGYFNEDSEIYMNGMPMNTNPIVA